MTTQREQALRLTDYRLACSNAVQTGQHLTEGEIDTVCLAFRDSEAEKADMRKQVQKHLTFHRSMADECDEAGTDFGRGRSLGIQELAGDIEDALAGTPAQPCTACADLKRTVELVCIGRDAAISTCAELKTLLEEKEKFIDASESELEEKQGEIERLREVAKNCPRCRHKQILADSEATILSFAKRRSALSGSPADPPTPTEDNL